MRNTLIPLEFLDDLLAPNYIFEQLLQVRRGIRAALVIGIKVLRFEQDLGGSSAMRNMRHSLLVVVLRDTEEVLQFASIPEVWSIPGTREDFDGNILCSIRSREILDFELVVHNFPQFVIAEILESEGIFDRKSASQTWVHVLLQRQHGSRDSSRSLAWNISTI